MDRSLKWRTVALFGLVVFCLATLAPSWNRDVLPDWFRSIFSKQISLGLDLQGGKHIVYNIDLNKAVDDKASDIKRDLEAVMADGKIAGTVKTPSSPLGGVDVLLDGPTRLAELRSKIASDYNEKEKTIAWRDCPAADGPNALCFLVSSDYADSIKNSALKNAVSTIRERINEKGVAEPSVVQKDDDIIVELPGDPKSAAIVETEELIARTAKLENKVVDDCENPPPSGCTKDGKHNGSVYMHRLFSHIAGNEKSDETTDAAAKQLGIHAETENWKPEDGGDTHYDYYLWAADREENVPVSWAKKHGKLTKDEDVTWSWLSIFKVPNANGTINGDSVRITLTGRELIERYLFGDPDLGVKGLANEDPTFKVADDHQIGFEMSEPLPNAKDKHDTWRTYYLQRAVELTGSGIQDAVGSYDPNTNRPVVQLEFNRGGGRIFGDLTERIAGMKLATILDDKVKSAPIINGAIRGGHCLITMGGNDPTRMEKDRDDLVAVLKTGSLPAPLREASHSDVGPTLGRDAIQKTRMSFELGILLVVFIMVGVYRWSGFIAVFAVVFHILMTLAVMALFGATLTLPGIAAIVLSIGMEVDGNILIYERIRDELNLGKSVRGAIDLGFSRAFSAILDGQLTTAAAGWVLLQYGSGPIKGFAVMLLVGVFTTLTTNIWVTRILFDWNVARKKGRELVTISI
ncbi:MAG TPA: protein translocase subunit SecD [Kofleriaceae bacterium]|jgi:preprotein translocase subunit SecD